MPERKETRARGAGSATTRTVHGVQAPPALRDLNVSARRDGQNDWVLAAFANTANTEAIWAPIWAVLAVLAVLAERC